MAKNTNKKKTKFIKSKKIASSQKKLNLIEKINLAKNRIVKNEEEITIFFKKKKKKKIF